MNFFIRHRAFSTFFLILELFQTYFLNIVNAPLSDLSWKTEKCRPEDLRRGAFSIRLQKHQQLQFKTTFLCFKYRFSSLACKVRATNLLTVIVQLLGLITQFVFLITRVVHCRRNRLCAPVSRGKLKTNSIYQL